MQFDTETTICAIATGEAPALRGAIRITGPDTLAMLRTLGPLPENIPFAQRVGLDIDLGELGTLPVSVFCWPDSRSYTGQPSAELHTLGAPVLLSELQRKLILSGVKLATRRVHAPSVSGRKAGLDAMRSGARCHPRARPTKSCGGTESIGGRVGRTFS